MTAQPKTEFQRVNATKENRTIGCLHTIGCMQMQHCGKNFDRRWTMAPAAQRSVERAVPEKRRRLRVHERFQKALRTENKRFVFHDSYDNRDDVRQQVAA